MNLTEIFVIFQVINAFISLGHKGYIFMIKLKTIITQIKTKLITFAVSLTFIIQESNTLPLFPLLHGLWRENR
jgi:hypothetical protein